ncbi:MAG TPA: lipoprotein-releasing ABC transporter permease subunit [bacterium]|nr:lipoprotein-releasing ABC transporter permease subunit [bacterium]
MKKSFELFVARRYLTAKGKDAFLSVITLISVGGVAVGVMALVVVISVMNGFEINLREKILGTTAHITVLHVGREGITDYPTVATEVERVEGVEAVAPFVFVEGILSSKHDSIGAVIRGVDMASHRDISTIEDKIVEGTMDFDVAKKSHLEPKLGGYVPPDDGIVLGVELARNLGVDLNDTVTLISPQVIWNPLAPVPPKMKNFRVVGIFDVGMYEFDSSLAYIDLETAQEFLAIPRKVNGLEVRVDDVFDAPAVSARINEAVGLPYFARDWTVTHEQLWTMLALEKHTMFVILTLIILVAAFNILSTLIMLVIEKTGEIGIMKAMGATNGAVVRIFVLNGLIIGTVGTALGLAAGLGLCRVLLKYQFIELPAEVYALRTLPVVVQPLDILLICVVALAISVAATIYPAWRAARLEPVEAIQHE